MANVYPLTVKMIMGTVRNKYARDSIISPMEIGPPKHRRRVSGMQQFLSFQHMITRDEVDTLKDFYHDTLLDGTDYFEIFDPSTASTKNMRFLTPPTFRPHSGEYFVATINLINAPDAA